MPNCKQCTVDFTITDNDRAFYERISPVFAGKKLLIPPPNLCPDCRYQGRLIFRNERNLYHRKSNATGKDIVSIYSSDNPTVVYEHDYWYGDDWDPLSFGREFDFSRPFFEQYGEMKNLVPRIALSSAHSINSEYTNQAQNNKNCYLITSSNGNEDCIHSHWLQNCHYCVDGLMNEWSEACYGCIDIFKCYNGKYLQHCSQCTDCIFCFDCKGCISCLGCFGLRNQKYHIFNQPVSEAEFNKKIDLLLKDRRYDIIKL
ncbi:hypothetical protein HY933_01800 [Candidatus Falkowbacteria bacterium]|nr:hypothetical protein [Candidatus Falkowbacteria bacterium]